MDEEIIIADLCNKEIMNKAAAYHDDRLAIIESLQYLVKELQESGDNPVIRVKAVTAMLCSRGKGKLVLNGGAHDVTENDLLICHPDVILEHGMMSPDFACYGFCLSPKYVEQLGLISADSWDTLMFIKKHPVIHLVPEEVDLFSQYFYLLRSKLTGTPRKHQKEVVDSLLQAFIYEFHDSLERFVKIAAAPFNSSENLFRAFIEMLAHAYPKERMVSSYAEKLCVSPKYLSAVCKEVSGHTASELINQYVMKDVEYLLRRSRKSIKEIAGELEFANLSFFGKYVRRCFGMSPKQYREQILASPENGGDKNEDPAR